jgi:hypothetical protein
MEVGTVGRLTKKEEAEQFCVWKPMPKWLSSGSFCIVNHDYRFILYSAL